MKRQEMADSLCRGGQTEKQWTLWETSGWLKRELFEIFPEMIVLRKWKLVFEHYRESPLFVPRRLQRSSFPGASEYSALQHGQILHSKK